MIKNIKTHVYNINIYTCSFMLFVSLVVLIYSLFCVHVLSFALSGAKVHRLCCILHFYSKTASIKPILLFTLEFFVFFQYVSYVFVKYNRFHMI